MGTALIVVGAIVVVLLTLLGWALCKAAARADEWMDSYDPMAPDYEALGNESVTSQYRDSRESAGL